MASHAREEAWWPDVTSIDVEEFERLRQAQDAERTTIRQERPRYNIALAVA
jgi:hypothetical protein